MAASVFLYHVVDDLTLGKPELVKFYETETVETAILAIGECSEGAVTVWRRRGVAAQRQHEEPSSARFVGMLNSLGVVAFMACVGDNDLALRTPISEVVTPNPSLIKEVDPGTRPFIWLHLWQLPLRNNSPSTTRYQLASLLEPHW